LTSRLLIIAVTLRWSVWQLCIENCHGNLSFTHIGPVETPAFCIVVNWVSILVYCQCRKQRAMEFSGDFSQQTIWLRAGPLRFGATSPLSVLGLGQPPILRIMSSLLPRVKRQRREADRKPPSGVEAHHACFNSMYIMFLHMVLRHREHFTVLNELKVLLLLSFPHRFLFKQTSFW
jgi:hypothetical protein